MANTETVWYVEVEGSDEALAFELWLELADEESEET